MGGLFTSFFGIFEMLFAWLPSGIGAIFATLFVIAMILLLLKIVAIILDAIPFL